MKEKVLINSVLSVRAVPEGFDQPFSVRTLKILIGYILSMQTVNVLPNIIPSVRTTSPECVNSEDLA